MVQALDWRRGRRTNQGRWRDVGELGLDSIFEILRKATRYGEGRKQ